MGIVGTIKTVIATFVWGKDEVMMSMFFAQRVILGKCTFAQVPAKLKEQVREILIDSGLEELCEE